MTGCLMTFMHIMAVLFFLPGLFVTIPLHIIASIMEDKKK